MPSAVLERHPASPCAALRGIEASVTRRAASLEVSYALEGEIDRLRIGRSGPLWQHTCCEVFIVEALPAYREYNFSPSGEWAAYEFVRYREGAPFAAPDPRIAVKRGPGRLELSASIPASPDRLRIGLSVVVEDESGALSYWALKHAPGKPDFHHPAAFALELE